MNKYQVGIIGGGPGGYVCALRAAQLGLSVVLIEGAKLGGTCLNSGCIPTKVLVKAADLLREIKRADEFGLSVKELTYDFNKVMNRKDSVVESLVGGVTKLLKTAKVRVINGWAELSEIGIIKVNTDAGQEEVLVDNVVIATGSVASRVPIKGLNLPGVLTSEEILQERELPKNLVIIGGGVIGLEFASIYSEFGSQVTVIEMLPNILANVDEEIPKRLSPLLKKSGISIKTKATVKEIKMVDEQLIVVAEDASGEFEVPTDKVLLSVGRTPNLMGIDIEALNLNMERKAIVVDSLMRTNLNNVYAIGDVTGGHMLAHLASMQGIVAAENISGLKVEMDYSTVPSAIFTYPEIATVGLTEQELKASNCEYKVSKFPFSANGKALALGETIGLVKILADGEGVILGASIMGPQASSLISELVLAIKNKLKAEDIVETIHAHPTLPEAIMEAAHGIISKPLHLS